MRAQRLKSILKNYLLSAWMPSVLLLVCAAIPVLTTRYAEGVLNGLEKPSDFFVVFLSVLLYAAIAPSAIASLGLLIAGIYQTLTGLWLKGLGNLIASIVLNLGLLALFLYGFIALP